MLCLHPLGGFGTLLGRMAKLGTPLYTRASTAEKMKVENHAIYSTIVRYGAIARYNCVITALSRQTNSSH
jgi:hypothetical protein